MSERYTSPDLSRRLRDAGLDQAVAGSDHWLLAVPGRPAFVPEIRNGGLRKLDTSACGEASLARAPRLDEVLEEIDKLGAIWHLRPADEEADDADGYLCGAEDPGYGPPGRWVIPYTRAVTDEPSSPAEAAGLVLAQLLEARKGGGA